MTMSSGSVEGKETLSYQLVTSVRVSMQSINYVGSEFEKEELTSDELERLGLAFFVRHFEELKATVAR